MIAKTYSHKGEFRLETGGLLTDIKIAYHISNESLDPKKPVVWICHALTANSNVADWWPQIVGTNKCFDPEKYTIICANIIGSCYGSTSAISNNPETEKPWLNDFPLVTVRDWAKAHELLRIHLNISKIHLLIGSSIGGFQAMEWAIDCPTVIEHLVLIATSFKATPWAIAINETERMAIEADSTFYNGKPDGGKAGLAAARALGLLTYRRYDAYNITQQEVDYERVENFKASSYQRYQGKKLIERFNAHCYYSITRSQDTHNVARGRDSFQEAFSRIRAKALCIGISSDILFPPVEQIALAQYIPNAIYNEIESDFGHDGFLVESEKLTKLIPQFLNSDPHKNARKQTNNWPIRIWSGGPGTLSGIGKKSSHNGRNKENLYKGQPEITLYSTRQVLHQLRRNS